MNKAELIQAVAVYYDGSKTEAAKALNAVVQTITYKTAAGEKVSITGFGVFEKVPRSARMVRNPRTGERKRAKATAVPRFRAGSDLKAYVWGRRRFRVRPRRRQRLVARRHRRRHRLRERRWQRFPPRRPRRPRRPLPSDSSDGTTSRLTAPGHRPALSEDAGRSEHGAGPHRGPQPAGRSFVRRQ